MKKLLAASVAALSLILATQQQASAWSKYNFGVGLNIGWEGGGNSVLWGMFKGTPSPGHGDGYFQGGGPGPGGFEPSLAPTPEPKTPEKVGPPTPVKPATYFFTPPAQPVSYDANPYPNVGYYPSYWYPYYPMEYPR